MFRPAYGRLILAAALTITTLSACGGPKTPETTSTHQQATGSVSQSQGADSLSQKTGKGLSFAAALDYLQSVGGAPVLDRTDTISGVDANGDGVRDDIATYVASLPDSEKQRKSLIQFHKALNMPCRRTETTDSPCATRPMPFRWASHAFRTPMKTTPTKNERKSGS